MAQQGKHQTLQDLSESSRKRKRLPDSFKVFMFIFLGWNYLGALLFTTGAFNFHNDVLDSFGRWSIGFGGLIGIGMVIIALWIYENN